MFKASTSNLTDREKSVVEDPGELDRQQWGGLEDQLWLRCPYPCRFDVHQLQQLPRPWEWLIWRCHTWEEVELVLNWHKVKWQRQSRRKIITEDGILIFRCA